jgi:hypothetical protein
MIAQFLSLLYSEVYDFTKQPHDLQPPKAIPTPYANRTPACLFFLAVTPMALFIPVL